MIKVVTSMLSLYSVMKFSHACNVGRLWSPFLQEKLHASNTFSMVVLSRFSSEVSGGKTALISALDAYEVEGVITLYQ